MRVEELSGRVLVDTNVLIYATLKADPRHEAARQVLAHSRQVKARIPDSTGD
jgi:predicted nucleic acid-binding protein